jgi:mannose-6-phosphate isomerase-like protein (cupin superfamily)
MPPANPQKPRTEPAAGASLTHQEVADHDHDSGPRRGQAVLNRRRPGNGQGGRRCPRSRLRPDRLPGSPGNRGAAASRAEAIDEAWYLLQGRLEIQVGDERRSVGAGSFLLVPHGAPHTFVNAGDGWGPVDRGAADLI